MKESDISMTSDDRQQHEAILRFGWDEWRVRYQMGSDTYQNFMRKLNPFAKAYFSLLDRYLTAERLLKEAQSERDHYKNNYAAIAESAHIAIKAFSDRGIKP